MIYAIILIEHTFCNYYYLLGTTQPDIKALRGYFFRKQLTTSEDSIKFMLPNINQCYWQLTGYRCTHAIIPNKNASFTYAFIKQTPVADSS